MGGIRGGLPGGETAELNLGGAPMTSLVKQMRKRSPAENSTPTAQRETWGQDSLIKSH